jgi:hypothetical protein
VASASATYRNVLIEFMQAPWADGGEA